MRKFLMGLTILAGTVVAASGVDAAPRFSGSVPVVPGAALLQSVQYYPAQYYEDWRYREWRRHEEFEHARRRDEWRHERHEWREHEHRGW